MAFGIGNLGEYYRGAPGVYLGTAPVKAIYHLGSRVWPTFVPFTIQNVNLTNEPVPAWTEGCWVTLLGGGGDGEDGATDGGSNDQANGGTGGGGGARLGRVFVPRELMGDTYTVNYGAKWNYTNPFDIRNYPALFETGDVALRARWGQRGLNGGWGGGTIVEGIAVDGDLRANGSDGGAGGQGATSGAKSGNTTHGAGSGGGGGGGKRNNSRGSGGASGTATGGTPGGLNQRGGSGAAASTSRSGGGGGGGGFTPGTNATAASLNSGGNGGTSLARLEWV